MPDAQTVPARYYARLGELLEDMGTPVRPLLDAAGIAVRRVQASDGVLSMTEVEALLDAALAATGRSDLGLQLGRALKLTSHNAVSYGILSSPTVGYALRLVSRYFGLILPSFRMLFGQDSRHMQVTVEPVWSMSHSCLAFHLELIAAAVHWEVRELLGGEMQPYHLYLSLREPAHAARYRELRELQPHFGWRARPGLCMQWPAQVAARPLALSDPLALKLAEQRCNEMVDKARNRGNIADWVSMMLREASGGPPTQTELAQTLNLSARTLDRYLKKEGASFRALSKRVCHAHACELLADPRLSVTQAAYELGYTDVSNFARAFRREAGVSPSAWRTARGT